MAELPLNGDLAFLLDKERLKIVSESENNFDKIQEILDYLMVEFLEGTTEYKYVANRAADIIFLSLKGHQTQITISGEFLETNKPYDIEAKLEHFQMAESIRKKKPPHITLTNSGIKIDTR